MAAGRVQRLRPQLEFDLHVHKPVDQDRAHLGVDVPLSAHVQRRDVFQALRLYVVPVNLLDIRHHALRVVPITGVDRVGQLLRVTAGAGALLDGRAQ